MNRKIASLALSVSLAFPALAHFLTRRPDGGEPLLAVAVRYFFRRHVEGDEALAHGLAFAKLGRLAEAQEAAFATLDAALAQHGRRLEWRGEALAAV